MIQVDNMVEVRAKVLSMGDKKDDNLILKFDEAFKYQVFAYRKAYPVGKYPYRFTGVRIRTRKKVKTHLRPEAASVWHEGMNESESEIMPIFIQAV
jgi:hypothetical protein